MNRPQSIPANYIETEPGVWVHPSRLPHTALKDAIGACEIHKQAANLRVELAQPEAPKTPEDRLNKTEREFLGRLRGDVYGHMQHIGIQSITLQLGFDCRYTPDFWTRMQGGCFRFWEVKGFMRDDARVKIHTAARAFPFWTFVLVKKEKGEWIERIIEQ